MEASVYFKALIDADTAPVVICDSSHTILYMNPAAEEEYASYGGGSLVGRSVLLCHPAQAQEKILSILEGFKASRDNDIVFEFHSENENKDVYMVALRDCEGRLIGYYEKHEYRSAKQ